MNSPEGGKVLTINFISELIFLVNCFSTHLNLNQNSQMFKTLMKELMPSATILPSSSVTISGDPDSPEVGQNFPSFSTAQTVPGG